MYAGDMVLFVDTTRKMKTLTDIWTEEVGKMKMEVNTEKTKYDNKCNNK